MVEKVINLLKDKSYIENSELEKYILDYNLNDEEIEEIRDYISINNINIIIDEFKKDEEYIDELENKDITKSRREYYKQILSYTLLSQEETNYYIKKYKEENDKEAFNKIFLSNLKLVYKMANMYHCSSVSFDDFFQEGAIGLIKGINKFDYKKGNRLSTYIYWDIKSALNKIIYNQGRIIRIPIFLSGRINALKNATKILEKEYNREPSKIELANYLNVSLKEIENLIEITSPIYSLDYKSDDDEEDKINDFSYKLKNKEEFEKNYENEELRKMFLKDVYDTFLSEYLKDYTEEELYNIYNFFYEYYKKKIENSDYILKLKLEYLRNDKNYSLIIKDIKPERVNFLERNIIKKNYYYEELKDLYKIFDEIDEKYKFNILSITNDKKLNELFIKANIKMENTLEELEKKYFKIFSAVRDYEVICYRYGIEEKDKLALRELQDKYGFSKERIRQIEEKALLKLKKEFTISKTKNKYEGSDFFPVIRNKTKM